MASGTFSVSPNYAQFTGEVRWKSVPNPEENTSSVTVALYLRMAEGSGSQYRGSGLFKLVIDGKSYAEKKFFSAEAGKETLCISKTVTVAHEADGTRRLSIRVQGEVYYGTPTLQLVQQGRTVSLDCIRRASVLSAPEEGTLGEAVAVEITAYDPAYTHTFSWSCLGESGSVQAAAGAASASWTPPESLADLCPNAVSAPCTLRLQTHAGDETIGVSETAIRLQIPDTAAFQPTIASFTAAPENAEAYAAWGYVQGGPGAVLTVSGAQGAHGSTIASVTVAGLGAPDAATGTWATGTLSDAGERQFTATAADSRGRTVSATCTISVSAYRSPAAVSLRAVRCSSDGEERGDGSCVKVTANFLCSPIGGRNTASGMVTCPVWTAGKPAVSGVPFVAEGPFSQEDSYTLTLTVSDSYGGASDTCTAVLPASQAILSVTATGKGIGVGKYAASDNLFDVAWSAQFREGVLLPNGKNLQSALGDGTAANLLLRNSANNIWIGTEDTGSAEKQGNIYFATKSTGNAYISREKSRSRMLDYGFVLKKLWSGSFSSDGESITVPGIGDYALFLLSVSGGSTPVLGMKNGSVLRGIGGFASGSKLWVNTVGFTVSGETLSYGSAAVVSVNASGTTYSAGNALTAIYGIV